MIMLILLSAFGQIRNDYWFRAQKNIPRNEIATCFLNFQDAMETRDKQKGNQKLFKELRDMVYSEETRPRDQTQPHIRGKDKGEYLLFLHSQKMKLELPSWTNMWWILQQYLSKVFLSSSMDYG